MNYEHEYMGAQKGTPGPPAGQRALKSGRVSSECLRRVLVQEDKKLVEKKTAERTVRTKAWTRDLSSRSLSPVQELPYMYRSPSPE